jgi:stage III sporulation protein AH
MKKKSIFGKKQVLMAGLVLALAGAVWLNMEYSSGAGGFVNTASNSSVKNLGDTQYVMNEAQGEAATDTAEADYFESARTDREATRKEAIALLKETAENVKADEATKEEAGKKMNEIALRMEKEASAETLIKSKGFEDAVVVIGDESVTVIVKSEELLSSQTLQIQDAVKSQIETSLEKIKIVAIK